MESIRHSEMDAVKQNSRADGALFGTHPNRNNKMVVMIAVHFFRVYPSKNVHCGAGVALAKLPTPHDLHRAMQEAVAAAFKDKERLEIERKILRALAAKKAVAKRGNTRYKHTP